MTYDAYYHLPERVRARWCFRDLNLVWHATFTGKPASRRWLQSTSFMLKSVCLSRLRVDGSTVREPSCPACRGRIAARFKREARVLAGYTRPTP